MEMGKRGFTQTVINMIVRAPRLPSPVSKKYLINTNFVSKQHHTNHNEKIIGTKTD